MSFWTGFLKQADLRETTRLQPHQRRAAGKARQHGGVLVYHGLGSGKTLTSLAATQGLKTDVVVPASLRENYRKEIKKHTTGFRPNVMSYEKAIKNPVATGTKALVLDEAHVIGRSDTKRSKELMDRASQYDERILMTGTPIRNTPSEIAPLINVVRGDRAVPADKKSFDEHFVAEQRVNPGILNRIFRGARPGIRYRIKNAKKFEDLVHGYVDYHAPSKEHFPAVSHEVIEAPMSDEQLKYYQYVLGKAGPALRWKIRQGMPPSKTESKQLNAFLSGARQISNSTEAFGGTGDSTKIIRAIGEFKKMQKDDPNFKALVYSNYLDSGVKTYAKKLEKSGITYGIFDGSLSDKKRKQMVEDYNSGKIKALLISGAGSLGLDLKGTKMVQLLEPHWNNPRLEQAMGRAIRYQSHDHLPRAERHVHVQRFHATVPKRFLQKITGSDADKSVDQYLDMMSRDKEALNNQFLDILKKVGTE